jgi:hypothetical protein
MGVAKENRDRARTYRASEIRNAEIRNTEMAKATFWRDLIQDGHILTFRMANGGTLTVGPYKTAVQPVAPRYAAIQQSKYHHDIYEGNAWGVALYAIRYCGRVRPYIVDGVRQ